MEPLHDLDAGTLRRIDWRELVPPVMLLKALSVSFRFLPILGLTFVLTVWFFLYGGTFVHEWIRTSSCAVSTVENGENSSPYQIFHGGASVANGRLSFNTSGGTTLAEQVDSTFLGTYFAQKLSGLSASRLGVMASNWHSKRDIIPLLLTFLVGLYFALAISRASALRLASTEKAGVFGSLRFACKHYPSLLLATGLPLFLAFLCLAPLLLLKLFPAWISTLSMPILLFLAFLAVLLLLGWMLGLSMMIASIAVDGCDGYDAFSKAFSYLLQRPFHYLFDLFLAILLGGIGFVLTQWIASLVPWVLSVAGIYYCPSMFDATPVQSWWRLWAMIPLMAPFGFLFVYKQTAFTAIYMILRRSVEDVSFDQFLPEHPEVSKRLRPIKKDPLGAPVMADPAEPASSADSSTESDHV